MLNSCNRSFTLNSSRSTITRGIKDEESSSPVGSFLLRLILAFTVFSAVILVKNSTNATATEIYNIISAWSECNYSIPEEYGIEKFVSSSYEKSTEVSNNGNVPHLAVPINGIVSVSFEESGCKGIILDSEMNEFVFPCIGGSVTESGENAEYGSYVVVNSENGVSVLYGLLDRVGVSKGDTVDLNSVLASMSIGSDNKYHLYIEVTCNGKLINPELSFV